MKPKAEDLVEFAVTGRSLPGLEQAVAADAGAGRELAEIRAHLALHDSLPRLEPREGMWRELEGRLAGGERRPLLLRYWMPLAAAALLLAALLPPRPPRPETLFGTVARTAGGGWRTESIARVRFGDCTITLDSRTEIALPAPRRLALRAGRLFLEAERSGPPVRVEAGPVTVTTLGTSFLVALEGGETTVAVASGEVRCDRSSGTLRLGAGEAAAFGAGEPRRLSLPDPRNWFRIPTLRAEILDPETLRIVVSNEMPDTITLAPPTGGEPLFFASYGGHDHPLAPGPGDPIRAAPIRLEPGESEEFRVPLPRPVPPNGRLTVALGALRAEAEWRR
jgi:hypothetical protein